MPRNKPKKTLLSESNLQKNEGDPSREIKTEPLSIEEWVKNVPLFDMDEVVDLCSSPDTDMKKVTNPNEVTSKLEPQIQPQSQNSVIIIDSQPDVVTKEKEKPIMVIDVANLSSDYDSDTNKEMKQHKFTDLQIIDDDDYSYLQKEDTKYPDVKSKENKDIGIENKDPENLNVVAKKEREKTENEDIKSLEIQINQEKIIDDNNKNSPTNEKVTIANDESSIDEFIDLPEIELQTNNDGMMKNLKRTHYNSSPPELEKEEDIEVRPKKIVKKHKKDNRDNKKKVNKNSEISKDSDEKSIANYVNRITKPTGNRNDKLPIKKDHKKGYQTMKQAIPVKKTFEPIPSTSRMVPQCKFNIVHADKQAKLQTESINKPKRWMNFKKDKTAEEDIQPIRFNLVLENKENKPKNNRGRKKNTKIEKRVAETQTSNGKIDRNTDFNCVVCGTNILTNTNSKKEEDLEYMKKVLEVLIQTNKELAEEIPDDSIDYQIVDIKDRNKPKSIAAPIVPAIMELNTNRQKVVSKHKVPTTKPKDPEPINPPETFDADIDAIINETIDKHNLSEPFQMDNNLLTAANYNPSDMLDVNRQKISLLPQGAYNPKPITKKDDIERIGRFNELYDNPLRPKLLEVEHPPEENKNTNMIFYGDVPEEEEEPEINNNFEPDDLNWMKNLSESEADEDDNAVFSENEDGDDEGFTETVEEDLNTTAIFDELNNGAIMDDFEINETIHNEEVDSNPKSDNVQEPPLLQPHKRIEKELNKVMSTSLLEIQDEELDFDDDIESPQYEKLESKPTTDDAASTSESVSDTVAPISEVTNDKQMPSWFIRTVNNDNVSGENPQPKTKKALPNLTRIVM